MKSLPELSRNAEQDYRKRKEIRCAVCKLPIIGLQLGTVVDVRQSAVANRQQPEERSPVAHRKAELLSCVVVTQKKVVVPSVSEDSPVPPNTANRATFEDS